MWVSIKRELFALRFTWHGKPIWCVKNVVKKLKLIHLNRL